MTERPQSLGEEIANSVGHGAALVAAIVGVPFLIASARHFGVANVVGACIFAGTMVFLYLTSTLYHALPAGTLKRVFQKLDHGAIYCFIAGSDTPLALGCRAVLAPVVRYPVASDSLNGRRRCRVRMQN